MTDVDYRSIPPADLLAEAKHALIFTGSAAKLVGVAKEILARHRPELCRHCPESRQHYECKHCGVGGSWPCPDVQAVFKALAVGEEDGDA